MTGQGLENLKDLQAITELHLDRAGIDDAALKHLHRELRVLVERNAHDRAAAVDLERAVRREVGVIVEHREAGALWGKVRQAHRLDAPGVRSPARLHLHL